MTNSQIERHTQFIKLKAKELGFDYCGIAKAEFLEDDARRLEKWLRQGMHATMSWMENHFDKRTDPRKLVEGAKSVVSLMLNYYPQQPLNLPFKISKYAYGKDYHKVIKDKLKMFINALQEQVGQLQVRAFTDSGPVLEKAWAARAGIGWIGKHSNLINKKSGSFYFLAELILDIELIYDNPIGDFCGTCTRCIDACPTQAIVQPFIVDSNKCISYLTIELKENIPSSFQNQMQGWAFGCDVCQDVCPWNRFSIPHNETQFNPNPKLSSIEKEQWQDITEDLFKELFQHSAVKRAGYKKLKNTISYICSEA
ncbi:MAG: tRNA epoxyqueuosine(34) reductase QueG [Cytophagaceae bacterium]|nr:tRNA epoxyqueuosine(34) reductase QueG [Cytophagaceae bacterium]MDW8455897.1 tRNA epoxyqueuosine(34) reductase QueG [Cytophagaceae bacterium]